MIDFTSFEVNKFKHMVVQTEIKFMCDIKAMDIC